MMPPWIDKNLVQYVNLLQGTQSHRDFSRGNTMPIVARPFGMTHWAPQTDEGNWMFHPDIHKLQGVRATHQASPWMGDYGHFTVMPQTGKARLRAEERASAFRSEELIAQPHYLSVFLRRYGILMEVTPTERCSIFRIRYPGKQESRIIFDFFSGQSEIHVDSERHLIYGFTRASSGGVPENFACYFAAFFNASFQMKRQGAGERTQVAVEFGNEIEELEVRLGTSFISVEQALLNLQQEVGGKGFDAIKAEGEAVWDDALGRITIAGATEEQRRTFYSCLYRTHLFPRMWHEYNSEGAPLHFSPYDGQVRAGVLYSDNGFWDTYRTVYPLFSLLMPERLTEILQGWTNACKEGGWFPQWASPGYRACMVGTHIDAVMADAVVKGITQFDVEAAYAGLIRHAENAGDQWGSYGRLGIADYLAQGYVSEDHQDHSVARTLDYAYDDWCISQIADYLGHSKDRARYRQRADNYRTLYDPSVGFMRGRTADGGWLEPFNEFAWGGPYVEGGPWQASWAVPQDPAGLIELMGGCAAFVQKLDRMLAQEPTFDTGAYGAEIHEMTEMAVAVFGQYAHSNQPVHHVLYLYTAAGRPDKTQYWVRRVMNELYTPDSLPGDEDNGEMAAWYVLNALGVYPLTPGHPSYVLGAPLYPAIRLYLENGKTLVIEAENHAPENVFVRQVLVNDQVHRPLWVSHETLIQGGHWKFKMSNQASAAGENFAPDELPFSLTNGSMRQQDI